MSTKIRVLLADDHSIVREGIKFLIKRFAQYEVVGEAETGIQTIEMVEQLNPDIVILDYRMPCMNGIEAARRIAQAACHVKIIALSANITALTFQQGYEAGIRGFVHKESLFHELFKALESVSQGSFYTCSRVRSLLSCHLMDRQGRNPPEKISILDQDMVRMLADGKSVGEIALLFNKSSKTIDARRRKIMSQLGLSNLAELTKYAISEGLTTTEIFS